TRLFALSLDGLECYQERLTLLALLGGPLPASIRNPKFCGFWFLLFGSSGSRFYLVLNHHSEKEHRDMATKLTPLHDRILVRRIEEAETSRGGIIIPDTAKDKPQEGEVIGVGKGKTNDEGKVSPLAVKAGDRILFGKYAGTEIKIDGEDFTIMREEEVLGILEGAAKSVKKAS